MQGELELEPQRRFDHDCKRCPLHRTAKTVCIEGVGDQEAELIVIGEPPDKDEDYRGKAFSSKPSNILRSELSQSGFHSVYYTHLVKCRTPGEKPRDPTPEEIKACKPYLDAELAAVKAKYILTTGRFSSKTVLKKSKITVDHGKTVTLPGDKIGMPVYNARFTMRDPSKLPAFKADLIRFRKIIDGEEIGKEPAWTLCETLDTLDEFLKQFSEAEEFSYDLETTGLFPYDRKGHIRCISIGLVNMAYVIPLEMPASMFEGDYHLQYHFLRLLVLMARGKVAIAQNGKFDCHWMRLVYGFAFDLDFDTMLASHIIDENSDHDLKYLSRVILDAPEYDIPLAEKKGKFLHIPEKRFAYLRYAAFDASYTLSLYWHFREKLLEDAAVRKLFYKITMPAARALERIERRGLTLDLKGYARVEKQVRIDKDAALAELVRMGGNINWNSHPQVREVLFKKLQLRCSVKTDKGLQSTGEDALVELKDQHPVAAQLVKYRELEKFLGTYIEGWKEFTWQGRLYLGYKIHGTVTGRYSSRLHQVPRDGTIRNLVTAPPGWVFCQSDLSQAELRIAAELSRDMQLVTCFRPGGLDVHWSTLLYMVGSGRSREYYEPAIQTAQTLAGVRKLTLGEAIEILGEKGHNAAIDVWKGWKEARKKAKAINFGFVFGMYENKFIQQAKTKYDWDCTYDEAHDFRTAYFELYQGILPWHEKQKRLVKADGSVRNLFGRLRRLPGIYSSDKELRSECERQAINSPVQGTIGDWKAAALVEIENTLDPDKLRIVGEHHDAILMIIRPEFKDETLPQVRQIMRSPTALKTFNITNAVPMDSEIEIGNWGAGAAYHDPLS